MLLILALGLMVITVSATTQSAPDDFGLRLSYGWCAGSDTADTFKGTYERMLDTGKRTERRTARIDVSPALKNQLFDLVNQAQFFETSERFRGTVCEPSFSYRLEVRSSGKTRSVSWTDCATEPSGDEARRMRALADNMLKLFRSMNSVKRLPKSDVLCL